MFFYNTICKMLEAFMNSSKRNISSSKTSYCYAENPAIPWSEVLKTLEPSDIVQFSFTNRYFYHISMDDNIWKIVCIRKLGIYDSIPKPSFSWKSLYRSLTDGSHTFSERNKEKHIDWMRIGAFVINSSKVFVTDTLNSASDSAVASDASVLKTNELMEKIENFCTINDIMCGIWIADLHLVRCPVCNVTTCEGTMQTLDVRNWELFLMEGWKEGEWEYDLLEKHDIPFHCPRATCAIIDSNRVYERNTRAALEVSKWIGKPGDWLPRAICSRYAVAASTNLQPNEGLCVKCEVILSGKAKVVGIRVSQQLL